MQPITRNQVLDANIVRESNHTPESKLWYNHMIFCELFEVFLRLDVPSGLIFVSR